MEIGVSRVVKRALIVGIPLLVGGVLFAVVSFRDRGLGAGDIEVSGPMPGVDAPVVAGGRVTPSLYRGKIVVVNFWASWCGPCRREQPGLGGRGVQFLGVNFKDDPAAARAYLKEFDVTYPSVVDRDGRLAFRFGIPYIPATVLVDASGEMRRLLPGVQTEGRLRAMIEELRTEPPPAG